MTNKTQVHIVDSKGNILFTQLFNDGSNVLCFESGFGHVTQDTIRHNNWELRDGWLSAKEIPCNCGTPNLSECELHGPRQ